MLYSDIFVCETTDLNRTYLSLCARLTGGDRLTFVIVFRCSDLNILGKSLVMSEPCCTDERQVILFDL